MRYAALILVLLPVVGGAQEVYQCEDDGGAYESYMPCPEGNAYEDGIRTEPPPESCLDDWECWLERHRHDARLACEIAIERQAKYEFEWTHGFFGRPFPRVVRGQPRHVLQLSGDDIKFLNGLGNWLPHVYRCDFDPRSGRVVDRLVTPGRR